MKKVELLSPAGNFECLKAAINNGADAVYLGGTNFSARAFADNFDNKEIIDAVNYAHLRNVKIFITLNTLLNEYEIDNAYNHAKYYYEHNVDGLIIQDLGLFYRIRKDFPDFELHASTQMHIHNFQGVKNAKELGFKRVVLARESDINLIKECCKEDIEIECFVHGAICVSYSGQCLMSSAVKNRSANKGMCAQCCRLKYTLYDHNKKIDTDTYYLLSPKDMCLLNDIPELIKAGVSSFKIEGRMKSPAYVGYVTRCYRKAIDAYYDNKKYIVNDKIINNMKFLFNRGFTNTYLLNDKTELFNNYRPNHMGVKVGEVVLNKGDITLIKLNKDLNQFDGIRVISKKDTGLILNMLKVNGKLVSHAYANEIIEVKLDDPVDKGDIVVKTLDYELENSIINSEEKLICINVDIKLNKHSNPVIKAIVNGNEFIYNSVYEIEEAKTSPISNEDVYNCFLKTDNHPYKPSLNIELDNCFIPIKKLNDIRRDFYDKLDSFILKCDFNENNISLCLNEIQHFDQKCNLNYNDFININPLINAESKYFDVNNLVKEFGGLLLKGNKDAYYTLNVLNSYAFEFLLKLGFKNIILSSEINQKELDKLVDEFNIRNKVNIKPYVFVKGNRSLMNIKRNPFDKYVSNYDDLKLSDGNNVYKVIKNYDYIEIIQTNFEPDVIINNDKYYIYTE